MRGVAGEDDGAKRAVRRRDRRDGRHVPAAQHLASPQDPRFRLGEGRVDAESEAMAEARRLLERQHHAGKLRRSAPEARAIREAPRVAFERRQPDLREMEARIPHERSIGEHPEVLAARELRQRGAPRRLERFVREAPVRRVAGLRRARVPGGENLGRDAQPRFFRRRHAGAQMRHLRKGVVMRHAVSRSSAGASPGSPPRRRRTA